MSACKCARRLDVALNTVKRYARMKEPTAERRGRTTIPEPSAPRHPDLVDRDFTASRPDQLWVADMTYVRTWSGWAYVAFVLDVYSRMIVGWQVANHMRTELPLDAPEMALWRRRVKKDSGPIHHSDRLNPVSTCPFGTPTGWGRKWIRPVSAPASTARSWPPRRRSLPASYSPAGAARLDRAHGAETSRVNAAADAWSPSTTSCPRSCGTGPRMNEPLRGRSVDGGTAGGCPAGHAAGVSKWMVNHFVAFATATAAALALLDCQVPCGGEPAA